MKWALDEFTMLILTENSWDGHFEWSVGTESAQQIDKIIGLFCKRALWKTRHSAKDTYNLSSMAITNDHHFMNVQCLSFDKMTAGWWKCIGCFVSCMFLSAREPLIIGLFCPKITYEDKSSYASSPPNSSKEVVCDDKFSKDWIYCKYEYRVDFWEVSPLGIKILVSHPGT